MPGNCDLSYLRVSQTSININWLNLTVEQRLKDQCIQKWKRELTNTASCDLYAKFHLENDLLLGCKNVSGINWREIIIM